MHPVVIDDALIQNVYAKHAGEPQPETQGEGIEGEYIPEGESPGYDPDAWREEAEAATMFLYVKLAPAWDIPDKKLDKCATSLQRIFQKWFPGNGFNTEKWNPYASVAFEFVDAIKYGVDINNFQFKPRYESDEETHDDQPPPPQHKKSKGKFTTMDEDA